MRRPGCALACRRPIPVPCLSHLSDAHFRRGDWDAAVTHAQLAIALAQDTDRPLDLARAHARAGPGPGLSRPVVFRPGRTCSAARTAAERFPLVLPVAAAAMAAVSLASARGDPTGVLAATEPVRATGLLGVGGCPGIFNWRAMEAAALIDLGRLDEAEAALGEFEAAIPQSGLASAALALARCRGSSGCGERECDPGRSGVRPGSLDGASKSRCRSSTRSLDLDDGRRLRTVGNQPAAVAQLEKAHHIFSDLGADPYVQACAKELAALQVTVAPDSPATLLGLSRAELAVARLVATGLTNKEVAKRAVRVGEDRGVPPPEQLHQARHHLPASARRSRELTDPVRLGTRGRPCFDHL